MGATESVPRTPILIEPYDERWREAHERFARKMWPTKSRRRDDRFNRWKFRGTSVGPVPGLLLAISGGEVLGQLGLIPAALRLDGAHVSCQWFCDLMVDSTTRRRGIASLLFESALGRQILSLGSNPSAAANATMHRVGFRGVTGPAIAVFPIDLTHVLSWKVPRLLANATPFVSAVLAPFLQWSGRRLIRQAGRDKRDVTTGTWREVSAAISALQAQYAEPVIMHGEEFLNWRCDGLPGLVEPLQALCTTAGSYAIVGPGIPYYYVYDWHADSAAEFFALFAQVLVLASRAQAKTIQALAHSTEEMRWLRHAGFLFLRHPVQILCHPPSRLLPKHPRMRYSIFDSDGNL